MEYRHFHDRWQMLKLKNPLKNITKHLLASRKETFFLTSKGSVDQIYEALG